jgi:hypothetical protein
MAVATLACFAMASLILAGCGPKTPHAGGQQTGAPQPGSTATTGTPAPVVKDVPVGNCTVYQKAEATKLLGGVNVNNKALEIGTDGGTKIDVCSYINLKNLQDLEGLSYGVVRYDSPATAFAKAKIVQTQMLGSAADHNWSVQSLITPPSGAGQLLGGIGTKNDNGLTYTIAVVGTNVGPYLVTALGASTESPDHAKNIALKVFQALSAGVS